MDDRERAGEWSLDREAVFDWLVAHRRAAVAIGLTAALIGAVAYVALRPAQARAPVEQTLPRAQVSAISAPEPVVVAHISGEVVRPAVFQLEAGSRVADLVDAAGGFTPEADPDRVNLAALVRDGDEGVHLR